MKNLPKVFLIAFSLVVLVAVVPSAFFELVWAFKPFAEMIRWRQLLFMLFFTQEIILINFIKIWVINCINLPWPKHYHLFLQQCSTYIFNNTMCFFCWFNVNNKRNIYAIWPQWRELFNNVVFQCHYVDLNMLCLACFPWVHVFFCP